MRISLLVLGTLACSATATPEQNSDTPPATSQPAVGAPSNGITRFPEEVLSSFRHYTGFEKRERLVVRDAETWALVWDKLTGGSGPNAPAPEVDFDRHMVLVASSGTMPSGGFKISIERYEGGTAHVLFTSPGRYCGVTMAITHPADAVLVPRTSKAVHWADRNYTHECGP